MLRKEVFIVLREFKKTKQAQYHIKNIGIFGSVARGEEHEESDIDIVVELNKQSLFLLGGITADLEECLHSRVDVVSYRKQMNGFLKKRIDSEAIYV